MSKVSIRHLNEMPELVPLVAEWIYQAFWINKGHEDSKFLQEKLNEAQDTNQVPLSLVAFCDGAPVGTINLIENDDDGRPNLRPWLAALWVDSAFRKRGVGTELTSKLLTEAKRLKIAKLYLETHKPDFYIRQGAIVEEQIGSDFFLMSFEIK